MKTLRDVAAKTLIGLSLSAAAAFLNNIKGYEQIQALFARIESKLTSISSSSKVLISATPEILR